jgi:serine/threonine-protein kinase HipA
MRGVSLTYGKEWLKGGFALSEDLPLIDIEHLPSKKDSAVGALDDARPDRWGEKVISVLEKPERSSVLEMLYFAGDERFGALGVSTSATHYLPRAGDLLPNFDDVEAVLEGYDSTIDNAISMSAAYGLSHGEAINEARKVALVVDDWASHFEASGAPDRWIKHAAASIDNPKLFNQRKLLIESPDMVATQYAPKRSKGTKKIAPS